MELKGLWRKTVLQLMISTVGSSKNDVKNRHGYRPLGKQSQSANLLDTSQTLANSSRIFARIHGTLGFK